MSMEAADPREPTGQVACAGQGPYRESRGGIEVMTLKGRPEDIESIKAIR